MSKPLVNTSATSSNVNKKKRKKNISESSGSSSPPQRKYTLSASSTASTASLSSAGERNAKSLAIKAITKSLQKRRESIKVPESDEEASGEEEQAPRLNNQPEQESAQETIEIDDQEDDEENEESKQHSKQTSKRPYRKVRSLNNVVTRKSNERIDDDPESVDESIEIDPQVSDRRLRRPSNSSYKSSANKIPYKKAKLTPSTSQASSSRDPQSSSPKGTSIPHAHHIPLFILLYLFLNFLI